MSRGGLPAENRKSKRRSKLLKRLQEGFTLVELLVVISIIGILSALLMTNFVSIRGRAGDTSKKNDLAQLKTSLRLYYNDFQSYPDAANGNQSIAGCGANGDTSCGSGGFAVGSTTYMKQLPSEFLYYSDGADTFLLVAELENASDESIEASHQRCSQAVSETSFAFGSNQAYQYLVCND